MIKRVVITKRAASDLLSAPIWIKNKVMLWVDMVEKLGLERVRLIKGLHDEPLKGSRWGQRSIRLNRAYRAIYEVLADNEIKFVKLKEINKHEY